MARCTVERRMRALGLTGAGPGRTVRTTGTAKGNPVPVRPAAPRLHRHRPEPQMGGRLHLRADLVGVLLHRLRHGPVLPPDRRLGHQRAHGAPTSCSAPWNTRSRRARNAGARTWRGWCTTPTTDRSTCPSPTPDDLSTRASRPPPEPWAPPTTTPPPKPSTSPTNANSSGATAPGRDAPTPATATARWVDWYNRTRPHRANPDDLPPTTVEHRYNHNHPTHHRITNPPQNPGLSRRVWSVCANGAGVVGVWAEDLLGRCIEHCR